LLPPPRSLYIELMANLEYSVFPENVKQIPGEGESLPLVA